MENFSWFVLPFVVGMFILVITLIVKYTMWVLQLSKIDKLRIRNSMFTVRTLRAIREVFMESLLHRNVYKTNPILGYMHMSFAFGWFLLIVVGHVEACVHAGSLSVTPWEAIFLRYFVHTPFAGHVFFAQVMDLILLYILSGVFMAYAKRLNSKLFGMKRTTKLRTRDYISMAALWGIFPLRLLAEGATAALHHNGGFLTNSVGAFMNFLHVTPAVESALWWAYSISLGLFFVTLPFTRYMHILTEVLYIFLKEYGIKLKKTYNSFSEIQVYSCSRCGICVDVCQMHHANISNNQSVYILKNMRDDNLTDRKLYNCLLCGRCEKACPVNINLNDLRISQRIKSSKEYNSSYDFLEQKPVPKADVLYFAGCMTHLTPGIKNSIVKVLEKAGINYLFLDKDKGACCGRPLMQAGQYEAAQKLIVHNREQILDSGAHTLLVSCPICYKVFKDDYELAQIKIVHHSEYFLELVAQGKITLSQSERSFVYHDPCELGRGCNVYEQPRELLRKTGKLTDVRQQKTDALCCSGSLGDLSLSMTDRNKLKDETLKVLLKANPDVLATACPLCKKTFVKGVDIQVKDIAEIVAEAMEE
ncbi:MAG: (Fe-S)-binding protein [Bacteroidales bacterium]|jgi:Fe-S oxidoreductase|nr:(Fe-S)-binding protein [Bacteroidales bacterium]